MPQFSRPQPNAPDLGSFPLDHFRECKDDIDKYFACLERNRFIAPQCRDETKAYLECRMSKGLMTPANVANFNIPETVFFPNSTEKQKVRSEFMQERQLMTRQLIVNRKENLQVDDGFELTKEEALEKQKGPK